MELTADILAVLTVGIFVVAVLYSAVGNAGSTGYLAVLSLVNIAPETIRPLALLLNLLVAAIGTIQFCRAGHVSWFVFWPFGVASVPAAFLGGCINLSPDVFRRLVGLILIFAAAMLLIKPPAETARTKPKLPASLATGAAIGLLSGLSGTGGGIFLTPWLLFRGWATPKTAAGLTMPFLFANSAAALAGNLNGAGRLPAYSLLLLVAAGFGGVIGSYLGSRYLQPVMITRALAAVLTLAGVKLLLT